VSRIRRREEVSYEEHHQDQFDSGANRIILVAGLDVPDEHGRARHFLEGIRDLVDGSYHEFLRILELHLVDRRVKERHWENIVRKLTCHHSTFWRWRLESLTKLADEITSRDE